MVDLTWTPHPVPQGRTQGSARCLLPARPRCQQRRHGQHENVQDHELMSTAPGKLSRGRRARHGFVHFLELCCRGSEREHALERRGNGSKRVVRMQRGQPLRALPPLLRLRSSGSPGSANGAGGAAPWRASRFPRDRALHFEALLARVRKMDGDGDGGAATSGSPRVPGNRGKGLNPTSPCDASSSSHLSGAHHSPLLPHNTARVQGQIRSMPR